MMSHFRYVEGLPELYAPRTEEIQGKRYYISPNGTKLPSITTVLGHFKKEALKKWRERVGHEEANKISNRAAVRGTKLHNLLESYVKNEQIDTKSMMPDLLFSFTDMKKMLTRVNNIHYVESPLYSENLSIAGRTDLIAEFDGIPSIIDFKTSSRVKKETEILDYFLQGTAYALMYEERVGQPINQIVILMSPNNGEDTIAFVKNKEPYVDTLKEKIEQYYKENVL